MSSTGNQEPVSLNFQLVNAVCWKEAIEIFNCTLTKDDKKRIDLRSENIPVIQTIEDIFKTSIQAKSIHDRSRKGATEVFNKVSKIVNKYAKVIDVFIQQQPDITAVVWGSVRFLTQIAVEEDETGQQIADALVDIVTEIGRWEQYLEVLTNSQRIQQSISVLYAHILSFLIRARAHYGKPKTVRYAKACLTPCKEKFVGIVEEIKQHSDRLEKEFVLESHRSTFNTSRKLDLQSSATYSAALATFKLTANVQKTMHAQNDALSRESRVSQLRNDICRLQEWLHPTSLPSDNVALPTEGTCEWVLRDRTYKSWVNDGFSGILWISGVLGCGKSVLAKFLSTQTSTSLPIIYHFRASVDRDSARPTPFVAFVLARLLQDAINNLLSSPEFGRILESLETLWRQNEGDSSKVRFKSLWSVLQDLIQLTPAFTLIVDALDECEITRDFNTLLSNLEQLGTSSEARVIILSRPYCLLLPFMERARLITMNEEVVNQDVTLFVNAEINHHRYLPRIRQQILDRISSDCHGMFLWAVFLLNHLKRADTPKHQVERLMAFPEKLDSAYEVMVSVSTARLSQDLEKLKRRWEIFLLLFGARRPLSIDEISVALALEPFASKMDETALPFDAFEHLSTLSSPFAVIHEGYLQIRHLSFKEFLARSVRMDDSVPRYLQMHMTSDDSNGYIVRKCFARLSEDQYREPYRIGAFLRKNIYSEDASVEDVDQVNAKHEILYEYAALNWQIHLTELAEPEEDILILAQNFLHGNEFVFWAEYVFDKEKDDSSLAKVRSLLNTWYSDLPSDSKKLINLGDFFAAPYRTLSNFYKSDGNDKTLTWLCVYRVGDFYSVLTDADLAFKARKEVVDGLTDLLGKNHPLTLRATSKLAIHYMLSGDMDKAAEVYLETSDMQLVVVGPDKPDSFESLHFAAAAQYYMTQYSISSTNQARAAAGLLRLVGTENLLYLMCQLSYAYAIAREGQLDQALVILESIYTNRSKLFGPENAMVLMAQVALADVQRKLGSLEPAESNLNQAYEARMRVWGISPFSSIDTVIHLIIVCRETGKLDQAQEHIDFLSRPDILEPFFERFCQVGHLRALLLIDAGKREQGIAILSSLIDLSLQKGRESNNRSLLWVRLTLATILKQSGKDDEASELFEDLVTTSGGDDSDSVNSLDGEPQPPRELEIAEKALRLVRDRKERQAELLLDENGLKWKRVKDFWIPTGGPAADTGWMDGP